MMARRPRSRRARTGSRAVASQRKPWKYKPAHGDNTLVHVSSAVSLTPLGASERMTRTDHAPVVGNECGDITGGIDLADHLVQGLCRWVDRKTSDQLAAIRIENGGA
jgi:hypothetical protein